MNSLTTRSPKPACDQLSSGAPWSAVGQSQSPTQVPARSWRTGLSSPRLRARAVRRPISSEAAAVAVSLERFTLSFSLTRDSLFAFMDDVSLDVAHHGRVRLALAEDLDLLVLELSLQLR